jgi:cell division protein FtsL
MKKTAAIILLALMILFLSYYSVSANDAGVIVDEENVTISLTNTGLQVIEEIKMTNKGTENISSLRLWIQQNTQDAIKITEKQSSKELVPLITGNIRTCNLSMANLSIIPNGSMTLQVTYHLPTNSQNYIKTLLYNTTIFSVTYENRNLFQGTQLYNSEGNNELQIRLYNPTEAPLNITMIVIIFVVAIIVLAILLLFLKKQRSKTKKAIVESEETLTTKKTLLLSLLKDLEKQYRGHSISDETYSKIKDEYKQHAVDVMKKLDDLKK